MTNPTTWRVKKYPMGVYIEASGGVGIARVDSQDDAKVIVKHARNYNALVTQLEEMVRRFGQKCEGTAPFEDDKDALTAALAVLKEAKK